VQEQTGMGWDRMEKETTNQVPDSALRASGLRPDSRIRFRGAEGFQNLSLLLHPGHYFQPSSVIPALGPVLHRNISVESGCRTIVSLPHSPIDAYEIRAKINFDPSS
jgi:hypothetical protein